MTDHLEITARALVADGKGILQGRDDRLTAGQRAFHHHHRAKCDSAAALGRYTTSMEQESVVA